MAAIFTVSFTAAAVLHRETALALVLCGVAMTTLVAAVIGANVSTPRRLPDGHGRIAHHQQHLPAASGPAGAAKPDRRRRNRNRPSS
jgi:hypothetical protein